MTIFEQYFTAIKFEDINCYVEIDHEQPKNDPWSKMIVLIERNLHTVCSIPIGQNMKFQAVTLSIPDLHVTTKSLHCIDHIKIRSHFFDVYIFQIFQISENSTIKTKSCAKIRNFRISWNFPWDPGSLFDISEKRYLATFFDDEILIFSVRICSIPCLNIFHHTIILLANHPLSAFRQFFLGFRPSRTFQEFLIF